MEFDREAKDEFSREGCLVLEQADMTAVLNTVEYKKNHTKILFREGFEDLQQIGTVIERVEPKSIWYWLYRVYFVPFD